MESFLFRLIAFGGRKDISYNRISITFLKDHYKMKSARIIREIHNEMVSSYCGLNDFNGRRRFMAGSNLDDDYVSPLGIDLPHTNS